MSHTSSDKPLDLEGVPAEEDVDLADAAQRVDQDPEEQKNYTDDDAPEVDGQPSE